MLLKHSYHFPRFSTHTEESTLPTSRTRLFGASSRSFVIKPFLHTKSIPKSLIDDGKRSKSILYHMVLLSNEAKMKIRPSRKERERTILFTDNMELFHHKTVKRIKEISRRKSCCCTYCGIKTVFEKKNDDFEARTQQAISSDLKLLSFTRAGQKKKQTYIKEFKIKQINEKKNKVLTESISSQQINQPSTQRDSIITDKLETDRSMQKKQQNLLLLLPQIKNIVSLTILKQIYIGGKQQQKQQIKQKPTHDNLIIKTYRLK